MVTVDEGTANFLNSVSKKQHKSISGVILELLNEAIDLRDDYYLSKIAEEAEERSQGKQRIPAEILWKELDLL